MTITAKRHGTNALIKNKVIFLIGRIAESLHESLFLKNNTLYGTDHKPSTNTTLIAKPKVPKSFNKVNDKTNCRIISIIIRLIISIYPTPGIYKSFPMHRDSGILA